MVIARNKKGKTAIASKIIITPIFDKADMFFILR